MTSHFSDTSLVIQNLQFKSQKLPNSEALDAHEVDVEQDAV